MKKFTIDDVRVVDLTAIDNELGILTIVEEVDIQPVIMKRVFAVSGVPAGGVRGRHAHKELNQVLVCLNGKVIIMVEDGNRQRSFNLTPGAGGLLVPAGVWSQQTYESSDSVLMVCCDKPYEEDDYLRNYEDYKKWRSGLN